MSIPPRMTRIHPGLSLLTTLLIAALLEARFSASIELPLGFRWPAIGIAFSGAAVLLVWARQTLHRANTSAEPHQQPSMIVTSGPFRFSRNPMYLANLLMSFGFACITGSTWFLAGTLIQFALLNICVIPAEETRLLQAFPASAESWFATTRRWI